MDGNSDDQHQGAVAAWQLCETEYVKNDNVPCRIKECLHLGSYGAAKNKASLKSENVTHILTVVVLDTKDTDIAKYFNECFSFIDEAKRMGGGVLVHCFAGASRSVTIVVAYLMKNYSMSLPEALEYVERIRPIACPNSGFMKLLQNFEKSLQGLQKQTTQVKIGQKKSRPKSKK